MKTITLTIPDEVDKLLIEGIILTDTYSTTQQFYAHLHHVEGNTGYVLFPQVEPYGAAKVIVMKEDVQESNGYEGGSIR